MAHDVFVSYSSQDKPTADAIVASLEANGIRCWIAPRDILPGSDWSESIVESIERVGTMVLVFSGHSNTSPQIRREIESAVSAGIPVIPFRIEEVLPSKSLQYFIGPQHWLDAWTPPLEQHLHRLTDTIKALLSKRVEGFDAAGKEPRLKPQTDTAVEGPTPESAEIPLTPAREELLAGISKSTPASIFSRTIPLILLASLFTAALTGGIFWWLNYHPAAPKISEKAMEQAHKEPVSPLRTPQAKGLSPHVDEQPGAPAKPTAEKITAEDYFNKGQKAKDWQERILFYNKAIELNPKYAEAYNYRGNAHFEKEYYEMALSDYNNAISLKPNWANPYNNRGNYYTVFKNEYDRALQDYDTAIKLNQKDARFYNNRAACYFRQNNFEAALRDYDRAIELDPILFYAYIKRGNIYWKKKEYGKALQDFNTAIEIDPNSASAYDDRGNVYQEQKDFDKALQDYDKAIEINPNYASAYNNRGNLYLAKNKYGEALQDYNKAIELEPNFTIAYINRGNIYLKKKEYVKALQDINKAIELDASSASAYNGRGNLYFAKKKYDEALRDYNKAIELDPNNPSYQSNRTMIYRIVR
jgi:tetratricopeptide (TPR) repeat protein